MHEQQSAVSVALERGRSHYAERRWADAFEALLAAEKRDSLAAEDLDRLVWAAALIGDDDAFIAALEKLHEVCVELGRSRRAARAAFWIGFRLMGLGASGRGAGWLARARRHIENETGSCAERGYLKLPALHRQLAEGNDEAAEATAKEAARIGELCDDGDLVALARNLQGRAVLRQQRIEEGLALLDEVMVAVTSGQLSPLVTGLVYCNVIATCQQMHAVDRAREWTAALALWCEAQPQLVTFTGYCLVHRSEILQLGGDWPRAMEEVNQVCDRVRERADPEVFGDACYQRAEILRLRGKPQEAEAAYRLASDNGRDPQPGLALLRLSQGRSREAFTAMERVAASTATPWERARVLPAFVEIALAVEEIDKARSSAEELATIAQSFGSKILGAMAAHAQGAVRLAEGDPSGAIVPLRHALSVWTRVGAPYIVARIRVALSRAYAALGDADGSELEIDGATQVFRKLGAEPDLAAIVAKGSAGSDSRFTLSSRELEVLRLVAKGKTNKAIARQLRVSERTIDRHLSNIFDKIDVANRAAATAYAYEHDLV